MYNELIAFAVAIIAGLIIGFMLKKVIKIALIVVGMFIFSIVVLQGVGWVNADYNKMANDTVTFVSNTNLYPQLNNFTSNFNMFILAGLTIGGIVGFIKTG